MKTLLLDKVYKPISFINFRRMVKLVMCDKVDIISEWEGVPFIYDMNMPSILRLRNYIRRQPLIVRFSYKGVFKRDYYQCQYTGEILPHNELTVDHVIPRSRGGLSTWDNCVTASLDVNAKKGDRTPEEVGLRLIKKPIAPPDPLAIEFTLMENPHHDWASYFPNINIGNYNAA
jgi:5-methylcytosine-specific restriction endonuclease McrA